MSTYVQVWVGLFHAVFKQRPRHNEKRGVPYLLRKIIGGGGGGESGPRPPVSGSRLKEWNRYGWKKKISHMVVIKIKGTVSFPFCWLFYFLENKKKGK